MMVIEASNLTRDYNNLRVVDQISFVVEPGEIFVLLGPDRAGKTTTIKMLTGLLRPTAGCAKVAGWNVVDQRNELHSCIGVVFENQNFYARLSARDNLLFMARLYGLNEIRVDQLLAMVGLTDQANDKVKKFSNVMKQRLLIARALLPNPVVLFLDEPTKGLDPWAARSIRDLVLKLSKQGPSVFLTTHNLEEADQISDRIAILDRGKIAAQGSPAQLKGQHSSPGATLEDVFLYLTGKDL